MVESLTYTENTWPVRTKFSRRFRVYSLFRDEKPILTQLFRVVCTGEKGLEFDNLTTFITGDVVIERLFNEALPLPR